MEGRVKIITDDSAQVAVDYIAGIGLFLVTVAFVFQFMYGLFAPFQSNDVTPIADRESTIIMDRTSVDKLDTINVIDEKKLNYFINVELNRSNETAYRDNVRRLGADEFIDMNVSVVTLDGTTIIQGGSILDSYNNNVNIGQARRLVLIRSGNGSDKRAYMSVRVW